MDYQYGTNVQAAESDPNGTPGQTRGNVPATESRAPLSSTEYAGHGPAPFPQNATVPDPLAEAFSQVGPGE